MGTLVLPSFLPMDSDGYRVDPQGFHVTPQNQMMPYYTGYAPQKAHRTAKHHRTHHSRESKSGVVQGLFTQLMSAIGIPETPQQAPPRSRKASKPSKHHTRAIPLAKAIGGWGSPAMNHQQDMIPFAPMPSFSDFGSSGSNQKVHTATSKHSGGTVTKSVRRFIDKRSHKPTEVKTIRTVWCRNGDCSSRGSRSKPHEVSDDDDYSSDSSSSSSESDDS